VLIVGEGLQVGFYFGVNMYVVNVKKFDGTVYRVYNDLLGLVGVLCIGLHFYIAGRETYRDLRRNWSKYDVNGGN